MSRARSSAARSPRLKDAPLSTCRWTRFKSWAARAISSRIFDLSDTASPLALGKEKAEPIGSLGRAYDDADDLIVDQHADTRRQSHLLQRGVAAPDDDADAR